MRKHKTVGYCDFHRTYDDKPIDVEITIETEHGFDGLTMLITEESFERYSNGRPKARFHEHYLVRALHMKWSQFQIQTELLQ